MQEYPPAMNNEPTNKKPHPLTAFAFLEVGLFEIVFVSVMVLLIFGTLNYFNILYVSETFPKYLGWLPSLRVQHAYTDKIKNDIYNDFIKSYYAPRPTPTPFVRFSYDTVKAQNTLGKYLKDNIREEFLPAKLNIEQNLLSSGELQGTDYLFGTNWIIDDTVFNGSFHYITGTNEFRDMEFYIDVSKTTDTSINSTNSAILVNIYLKDIPTSIAFDCGIFQEKTQFCEYFKTEEQGKKGFGAIESRDETNKKTTLVFSCFIPKNDSYYNKRTSCLLFREKDPSRL